MLESPILARGPVRGRSTLLTAPLPAAGQSHIPTSIGLLTRVHRRHDPNAFNGRSWLRCRPVRIQISSRPILAGVAASHFDLVNIQFSDLRRNLPAPPGRRPHQLPEALPVTASRFQLADRSTRGPAGYAGASVADPQFATLQPRPFTFIVAVHLSAALQSPCIAGLAAGRARPGSSKALRACSRAPTASSSKPTGADGSTIDTAPSPRPTRPRLHTASRCRSGRLADPLDGSARERFDPWRIMVAASRRFLNDCLDLSLQRRRTPPPPH